MPPTVAMTLAPVDAAAVPPAIRQRGNIAGSCLLLGDAVFGKASSVTGSAPWIRLLEAHTPEAAEAYEEQFDNS